MKDSIGGVPALAMVFVFIIIISGYLAFTINYSKAFKMKSAIVDILQESDNLGQNTNLDAVEDVKNKIRNKKISIDYSTTNNYIEPNCDEDGNWQKDSELGFCYKIVETPGDYTNRYIKVKTFVSIDVPIINKVLPNIKYFVVEGSTKSTRYDTNE